MVQKKPQRREIQQLRFSGDELIVKRALRDKQAGWLLVSDNPDKRTWPTKPWPDDGEIVGEVKWLGRSFT